MTEPGGDKTSAPAGRDAGRHVDLAMASVPFAFVFLWASGYIVAKFTLGYAEPFTILVMRFFMVSAIFAVIALATGARWPRRWSEVGHHMLVGVLLQTVYLGGIYAALALGISAGVSALVMALQPIITAAVVGPLFGERVRTRQWLGLLLGFAGVALVVANKVELANGGWVGLGFCIGGLAGITIATLYQKHFVRSSDLRTAQAIQYFAAGIATAPIAFGLGLGTVDWSLPFLLALAWLLLPLSVGTYTLYLWLIRRDAATRVTSYLYLVPPVTALAAWPFFGETMGPVALAGMVVAVAGVALVVRK
ncbi:MAG: DMT family transporter [Dongiaceae bacterium]